MAAGQMTLSLLNTLFTLGDYNAVIAIIGMYGAIRGHRHALLAVRCPYVILLLYLPAASTLSLQLFPP